MTTISLTTLVFLILALVASVLGFLYQRGRAMQLEAALAACARALLNAPLKYMSWQPKAPHCGGLWCILHLPPAAKFPLIATVEVKDNVTAEGVRSMLHGATILMTLGPLPRLSEQMPELLEQDETRRFGEETKKS